MQKVLSDILDSYREEMIENLQKLLRIPSVESEAKEAMPFGEGVQKAFDFIMALGVEKAFECVNFDNYAGEINFGSQGPSVGIVSHLDVVPEGEGWSFDPYGGEISEGKIYGRGAIDDKGPLIAAFYACLAIRESGLPLNKKIKQIIGTNEESTKFPCIKHYKKHAEVPTCGIVPDSWFPVAYAEKGIYNYQFEASFGDEKRQGLQILKIEGGQAFNIVAPSARAELVCNPLGIRLLEQTLTEFPEKDRIRLEKNGSEQSAGAKAGNLIIINASGEAAHASVPEQGLNAIGCLLDFLGRVWKAAQGQAQICPAPEALFRSIDHLAKQMGKDSDGSGLGIRYADDTGALTNNLGLISYKEGKFSMTMNLRSPVTMDMEALETALMARAKDAGMNFKMLTYNPHFYIDPESDAVKLLTEIYQEATGDIESKPKAHGGGSYARILPGFIPMGPYQQGNIPCFHRQDEHIGCDHLLLISKIYAEALYQLAK